ncbi:MAG: LCP family protein [Dehalococcoidia bacterium]|nr:LCP family protein [Dehalococcoidia bacterium]
MKGKQPNSHVTLLKPKRKKRGSRLKSAFFLLFFVAFVSGSLYFGYIFIANVRTSLITLGERFDLPMPIISRTDNSPNWGGKERVNILLLGVDQRLDQKDEPTRSDVMLVVTLDPYSKTAGMLSIPRDLYVPIPLSDKQTFQAKINTAHFYGDYYKYDGGGPALAKKTVQYNLGIKIHYYARVDFDAFLKIVNTLGGVTVDVETPLKDDEYPTPYYGIRRVFIPIGLQHMDGETALQYARSRHQDSDFGRTKRQQKVLLAIRQRALQLELLPKLPQLIIDFKDSVQTDLSPTEMLALARLGKDVDTSTLTMRTIEYPAVTSMTTDEAGDILLPVRSEIAKIVAEVFFDPRLREQAAKVVVQNGTRTGGLATGAVGFLKGKGVGNVEVDASSEQQDAQKTAIISYKDKKYTAQLIASWLSVPEGSIQWNNEAESTFDLRVIIGKDFKLPSN